MNQSTHIIPSREEILGIFRSAKAPLDLRALALSLKVKADSHAVLTRRLNAMERDGQIVSDGSGFYVLADHSGFVAGRVSSHRDGYGFVIPDEPGEDLYLSEREMQKVMHGDRVLAKVVGLDRRGRAEGTIVEVVQRANTHIIGRLLRENGVWLVVPEDKRISHDIIIEGSVGKAKADQIVSVELTEQPGRFKQPMGRLVEVLGALDDPGMEIEIAVRKFGVPHIFSDKALNQAKKLPDFVREEDLADRVDLRDVPLVTIDGEDARDFDDAVYCEPVKIGRAKGFRLIVAIADVSHYVKPNDGLDGDALERSTSVYFPRRVIPMLPEKLSNGLCSLNPNVDRLSLVCDAVITAQGEIKAYQFYPAVMHSAARFTYNEVAAILANTKGPEAVRRGPLVPHLQNLYDVFHALQKARLVRGAIDFETTETYIVCNPSGKIEKIIPRTRNDAHKVIEECMLAANVCAADLLLRHKHPGTYRIHAGPTKEKLTQVRNFLKQVGLSLGGGDTPAASDYAELMGKIKERPDASLLQTMLLRSMQQAVYSPDNIGHFGLAYEAYAHFTSPIRRYPDLLTHRAIKAILLGKKYEPKIGDKSVLNTAVSNATRRQQLKDKQEGKSPKAAADLTVWDALGVHCSANERRADEASRDVEQWLKCYYMQDKLGEEFTGMITGVTTFGIFVQLEELFVEGLVHITDLGADYFQYDDARHELKGERTGKRYQLTDKVKVQVVRVDLDTRKIDLRLAASETAGIGVRKPEAGGGPRITPLYEEDFDDEEEAAPRGRRKPAGKGAAAGKPGKAGAAPKAGAKAGTKAGTKAGVRVADKLPSKYDLEPLYEPLVPPPRSRNSAGGKSRTTAARPAANPAAKAAAKPQAQGVKAKAAKPKRSKTATAAKSKKKR
ncbi:ribonuclease R [Pseudoduganella ginsengisoli]|uniref:Ribonuclease R n=1 Tax=Pseudoduganella ginsengisoli TaxID=1462440 RepID=A0A6L6Q4T0_9BURK|nr:ribonuclease R [Pseudoduganella ginsengisoli]MTW04526.1 ribonuclease R [Pseudoduganella ginsengisoli]